MDFCCRNNKYDILIFVETKIDEFDETKLPDVYSYHGNFDKI